MFESRVQRQVSNLQTDTSLQKPQRDAGAWLYAPLCGGQRHLCQKRLVPEPFPAAHLPYREGVHVYASLTCWELGFVWGDRSGLPYRYQLPYRCSNQKRLVLLSPWSLLRAKGSCVMYTQVPLSVYLYVSRMKDNVLERLPCSSVGSPRCIVVSQTCIRWLLPCLINMHFKSWSFSDSRFLLYGICSIGFHRGYLVRRKFHRTRRTPL